MKASDSMIMFLFNEYPMLDYKEWVRYLQYNAESNFYYTESFSLDVNRNIMNRTMSIRDRDGIYLLCKLLARFRSLRHQ
jgi:hypothetical protein